MDTTARIAATIIVMAAAGWAAQPESVEQITPIESAYRTEVDRAGRDDPSKYTFSGGTRAQVDKMLSAIDRYTDLGLELPSLAVVFAEGCRERFSAWGRIQWDRVPWRIEVCTTAVYLHELAHAWDRWNLTDDDRRRYMGMRGLEAWQGSDIPWEERGQEDLAILVARVVGQGVDNYRSDDRVSDLDHFERITGVPVPDVQTVEPNGPHDESPQY